MYRPIVVCCSQRFKEGLEKFVTFLEKKGVLVFYPDFKFHRKKIIRKPEHLRPKPSAHKTSGLVRTHLEKIDEAANMGSICLIFNPFPVKGQKRKYGYIGKNTLGEIFYAKAKAIPVIMLKPNEEDSVMALVHVADRKRIFTMKFPNGDPMDYEFVWDNWLSAWVNGGRGVS